MLVAPRHAASASESAQRLPPPWEPVLPRRGAPAGPRPRSPRRRRRPTPAPARAAPRGAARARPSHTQHCRSRSWPGLRTAQEHGRFLRIGLGSGHKRHRSGWLTSAGQARTPQDYRQGPHGVSHTLCSGGPCSAAMRGHLAGRGLRRWTRTAQSGPVRAGCGRPRPGAALPRPWARPPRSSQRPSARGRSALCRGLCNATSAPPARMHVSNLRPRSRGSAPRTPARPGARAGGRGAPGTRPVGLWSTRLQSERRVLQQHGQVQHARERRQRGRRGHGRARARLGAHVLQADDHLRASARSNRVWVRCAAARLPRQVCTGQARAPASRHGLNSFAHAS